MTEEYSPDFEEMAQERDKYTSQLTDEEIWRSVVGKVIALDTDYDMKIEILLQSFKDVGIIFGQLKFFNAQGKLPDEEYQEMIELLLAKLEKREDIVDFNPLTYKEE